ncbi:MAG: acetate kinase [Clostridia bacterium]|nr:acetate kinase [Clostridia bacterium]
MNILVINCGSSSLKYQLIDMDTESVIAKGNCEKIGLPDAFHKYKPTGKDEVLFNGPFPTHLEAVESVLNALADSKIGVIKSLDEISAVGHRIVQGGSIFKGPAIVTDEVIEQIEDLASLAPLHNKAHAIGIRACRKELPDVPMVVVFDTSFHQTMPDYAYMYGIPYEMYEKGKIRRYGFHGTSHHYVALRTAEIMGKDLSELKLIICHLGNGSSITAIKNGKVIDTTMGLTPLDGLMMGTRCGAIDPAVIPFVMENFGVKPEELNDFMNKKCGMQGISGVSSDFRDLQAVKHENDRARLALDMFCYQAKKYIGGFIAALNGIDALVFTAGVGENDYDVREQITDDMDYLGIVLNKEKNHGLKAKESDLTGEGSKAKVYLVPTNEELMIARETLQMIGKKY